MKNSAIENWTDLCQLCVTQLVRKYFCERVCVCMYVFCIKSHICDDLSKLNGRTHTHTHKFTHTDANINSSHVAFIRMKWINLTNPQTYEIFLSLCALRLTSSFSFSLSVAPIPSHIVLNWRQVCLLPCVLWNYFGNFVCAELNPFFPCQSIIVAMFFYLPCHLHT